MSGIRFQVLGYRNFNRKADNRPLTVLTAASQCTSADNAKGSFGMRVTDFFLPDEKVGTLTGECIGQEFIPVYGIGAFGRPMLEDFELKAWK